MKELPYLPEGCEGRLTSAQQKFVQLTVETELRLRRKGFAVFRDRGRFCQHMFGLAKEYQYRQQRQSEQDDARTKFAKVSARVQQLQMLQAGLEPAEIQALEAQMSRQWANASMDEREGRAETYCAIGWPFRALPVTILDDALEGLGKASAKLSRASRTGRAKLHTEHWAAREFVRICHATGWSPIRMANSSRQVKDQDPPRLPDVVYCLAAVFEMAGVAQARATSRALTVLRALRATPVLHPVRVTYGPEDEYDEEEWFEVSLHNCVSEEWKGMPNFIPKDRR
ncbi:hypothetical protein ABS755_01290 [Castellaniella sp. FW104-16D08]|uniref:hypothetical protein n=1 Tax=unclassified Castellaniella TaxID=2617606 RepID=UPI00331512E7